MSVDMSVPTLILLVAVWVEVPEDVGFLEGRSLFLIFLRKDDILVGSDKRACGALAGS